MRGYGSFSRRPRALFATLGTAGLSCTHRSQCGLHGVVVAFMLSVFSSVSYQAPSSFFLTRITILLSQQ